MKYTDPLPLKVGTLIKIPKTKYIGIKGFDVFGESVVIREVIAKKQNYLIITKLITKYHTFLDMETVYVVSTSFSSSSGDFFSVEDVEEYDTPIEILENNIM